MIILNDIFLERLKNDISESDYKKYLLEINSADKNGFTINLHKLSYSSVDLDYIKNLFMATLIFKNDNYAYFTYNKKDLEKNSIFVGKHPFFHMGLIYIQEPTAANVLENIDFRPYDKVIDLCASPGGKSCIAAYSIDKKSGGVLISNDVNYDRAKVLSSNIERMGFDNTTVICSDIDKIVNVYGACFDKVIVDAPCSGEGMFRKSDIAIKQWSTKLVESCSDIQKKIFDNATKLVKPNGMIIYSTCTFSREEDEENVEYFLKKYPQLELLQMKKMYPFNSIGEGQFYAIFKCNSDDLINDYSDTELINLSKKLNVLRSGSKMEETKNGRIEPTHESTHYDVCNFENIVDLDEKEILKYLHGDTIKIDLPFKGWCKITYKGLGVGLAKYSNGILKNHYPKGLRNL